jgi:hypothetical protein
MQLVSNGELLQQKKSPVQEQRVNNGEKTG